MTFYFVYIIASFLLFSLVALGLHPSCQDIIGVVLILSIGLVHGANDIAIIKKFREVSSGDFDLKRSIFIYSAVVLITLVLFIVLPQLALWLFILISAYHFGEQHWANTLKGMNNILKIVFFSVYGIAILFLLLWINAELSMEIIQQISEHAFFDRYLLGITKISFILLLVGFVLLALLKRDFANRIPLELLQLFSLFFIFEWSSLILGFAFYFIFWHSLFSIKDQLKFLYGSITKQTLMSYFKASILYWLVSIAGLIILVHLLNEKDYFYALMFAFIAAVTFPHVFVIGKMMNKSDKK